MADELVKPGHPTDYSPKFCQKAASLCVNGATDEELAQAFDVSARTIYRWKAAHPEFCQAVKAGKDLADERVVRSLYHKAVGYTFDAVKIFMPANSPSPVYAEYQEHVPPDTAAAMFWLKNRRPDDWRDKTTQEVTGANGAPLVPIINLSGRPESPPSPEAVGGVRNASD